MDIPPDPSGVLGDSHAAREILGHESLVIVRQLEMLNVFMGVSRGLFFFFPKMTFRLFNSILFFLQFEQANRYAIHSPDGQLVGL